MKKKTRNLVILLVALILVFAAYHIATSLQSAPPDSGSDDDGIIMLVDLKSKNVKSVSYTYRGETLTVLHQENGLFTLKEEPSFPLDQTLAGNMTAAMAAIGCDRFVGEGRENFASYGLDDPEYVLSAVYDDQTAITLQIGDYNSFTGNRYVNVGGTDRIYMISVNLLTYFSYGKMDLVADDILPKVDITALTALEYRLGAAEDPESDPSVNRFTYDAENDVWKDEAGEPDESETGDALLAAYAGLTLTQCEAYGVKETETLRAYGLDDPVGLLTLTYTEEKDVSGEESGTAGSVKKVAKTVAVRFGSLTESGDRRYVMLDGSQLVYSLPVTSLGAFSLGE